MPIFGIIIVTIFLVVINELTEWTFIQDYALIFIMSGMFLGYGLTKLSYRSTDKNNKNENSRNSS